MKKTIPLVMTVALVGVAGCDSRLSVEHDPDTQAPQDASRSRPKSSNWMIGPGVSDFSAELCGDYSIFRSSAHQIVILHRSYQYAAPIIPTKVVEVGHDNRFVIAKRNALERRSPDNPNDTYMQPTHDIFDYWILDTRIPKVYGPLTQEEFTQKRQELDVPDNVVMKDVYEYRPK